MRVCGNYSHLFYRYLLPLLVGSTIQPLCLQLGKGRVNLGKEQLHFYISAWPSVPGVYNEVFDGRVAFESKGRKFLIETSYVKT